MNIDVVDHKILMHLNKNARLSNQELAELVNLSASACHRRVKILERIGVIEGYQAKLNYEKLGMNFFAIVEIKLFQLTETDHLHMLEQFKLYEEVINAYIVTGESNYILYVRTKNLSAYSNFVVNKLNKIKGIMSINSKIVLEKLIEK